MVHRNLGWIAACAAWVALAAAPGCGGKGCSGDEGTATATKPAPAAPAEAKPAKAEPAKAEPAKAEPAKAEPAKAEPAAEKKSDYELTRHDDPNKIPGPSPDGPWPEYTAAAKKKIKETITDGQYHATVDGAWGTVEVIGTAEGVEGVMSRYWAAFATADFYTLWAFTTGGMHERLGSFDHEAGPPGYMESINARMVGNPIVRFRIESTALNGDGTATAMVAADLKDGTVQTREIQLQQTREGWRLTRVRLRR